LGALGIAAPGIEDYAMFFSGFMMASVTWAVFCAAAIDRIFKKAGQKWVALTYHLCAVIFMVLAVNTVRELFSHLGPSELHVTPPAIQAR
jgi:chemosensory pili system protein ChpE/L-lysine exporter family protein LysE/ArgO